MGEKRKVIRKKKLRRIITLILAVIAVVSVWLALAAPGYIHRHINEYVLESTNGEYELYFSDIRANLYTQTVRIDSLRLIPQKTDEDHYSISATQLTASGISVFDFFLHKELRIQLLRIQKPEFEIYGRDGQKRDALDKQALFAKLKPFFSKQLKLVTIDEISLEQAHFDHYRLDEQVKTLSSIKDLDVGIQNFTMDSDILSSENEFFNADDIYIKIKDFNRALGDSIHRLQVAELTYSIEKNSITGKNMSLAPVDTTNRKSSLYWINIPEIKLSSEKLRTILGNDSVNIDSVLIKDADIRVKPGTEIKRINFRELKKYDLFELVKHDFNFVRVGQLDLEAKRLFFEPKSAEVDNSQLYEGVEVKAANFQLDSIDNTRLEKVLYSDNFELSIQSYSLKLNDKVHLFQAENILVSSSDSLMKAESISLKPQENSPTIPVTVQLNCDSLVMQKVDLPRLFHFRELPLNLLSVYHPQITVNQKIDKDDDEDIDEQSMLYNFIRDYIKGVYANLIAIDSGHIEFNDLRKKVDEGHISTDFDFRLTDFSLDSISARQTDKLFFATNLELNFSNYQMKLADQLHILNVGKIEVSSLKQSATISQLRLSPDKKQNLERALKRLNRSELYDIRIPRLTLLNTDIHHAFFRKKLNINKFNILKPKIYLEVFAHNRTQNKKLNIDEFYDLVSDYITDIRIENFNVDDGDFQFVNHSRKGKTINLTNRFSLNLDHFLLNAAELHSKRMLFSDNFELKIKDHLFKLSDNVHYLKASEISFSSKNSTGTIKNALLYPEITSEAYSSLPWHLQISIPQINLKQVNLEKAIFNETLNVGAVEVESPLMKFYKNKKEQNKFNFKDLSIPLPEELKELSLGKLTLRNGKLVINNVVANKDEQLAEASVDFELEQVNLKRSENNKTARFSSGAIETNFSDIRISPKKIPYTIGIKRIRYSSVDQLLDLTDLNIKNEQNTAAQIQSISMPRLKFEKLNATDAFDHNRFHASKLIVTNPVFTLKKTERDQSRNPFYIRLSDDLSAVMDELSAEEVLVENATLNLIGKKRTTKFDQVDITMSDVKLDSIQSTTPLGAKDLSIVRRNIQYTDKQKLYDLLIDQFAYSTQDKNIVLKGLHVIPRYGPDKFQQFIDFQQDYYSGDINQVKFEKIDIDRWFEEKEFTGTVIDIDRLNLLIFRDKRLPFNMDRYPPMPQNLIRSIDLPFFFDTLKISNSNFIYTEQLDEIPEPGRVSFERLNAKLYPFTNLETVFAQHPDLRLKASTYLMGVSQMDVQVKFNMQSPANRFEAKGSLSPFDLTTMNPITENAASISIRSGQLNRFEFEFEGDSTVANGKLRFAYDDLKITILAHKNGNTKEAKFLSFLANSLMVKSKHPRTRILLPDDIHYYRDPNKSTLNYLWKSVFSGAKNTFGVKEDSD
ncbi:AsmA family protein [Mangrovibacterium diazotrophicum]|uniref:DUF748 domain-containing protein n=1 Tax=Mangrovibacterium diazotrophicum TaxID=1261403 RepID=A0A419VWF0_9BACT|nr:hypothetical protein [Mangrovibacterium diazotrophicum]RKD86487.1 hypothetical protein BC643_4180 [Mangrovibacterium diazotrophicum]